jgi:hypothetical protein
MLTKGLRRNDAAINTSAGTLTSEKPIFESGYKK